MAPSCTPTASAEDIDEGKEAWVGKRPQALVPPGAEVWEKVPPLGARELLVIPSKRVRAKSSI